MSKSLQKNGLIAEIAAATELEKKDISNVLDKLAEIAYREAINEFTIPGICKLKVVTKKASRCRNPGTGQMLLIGERKILKVIPVSKAKDIITPKIENNIQVIAEEPPAPVATVEPPVPDTPSKPSEETRRSTMPADAIPPLPEAPAPSSSSSSSSSPAPSSSSVSMGGEGGQIVFNCLSCGTLLAAPPTSAGATCTCPYCKILNRIPSRQQDSSDASRTQKDGGKSTSPEISKPAPKPMPGVDFVTFICQTCGQEIEAPIDMMGMDASCPTCASSLHVPASFTPPEPKPEQKQNAAPAPGVNMSSMTIRIDLSDLE